MEQVHSSHVTIRMLSGLAASLNSLFHSEDNMPDNKSPSLQIDTFNPAATQFSRWLAHLNGALTIMGITGEDRVPYLLHYLGSENFGKFSDFKDSADLYKIKYDDLKTDLEEYFGVKKVEIAETYKFNARRQLPGESVKSYVTALKGLAQHCGFGDFLSKAVRNQFVCGMADDGARQRLLETEKLDLDSAIKTALSMELSKVEKQNMSQSAVHIVSENKKNECVQVEK